MTTENHNPQTHTYVLLDRSGSMAAIADDVVGGFNSYLASVVADDPGSPLTLVQFDTQDPHDLVADAVPAREVTALTAATFRPRGGTPLLDATGHLIARAGRRAADRARAGEAEEDIVVVTVTDGHENASTEYTTSALAELVRAREAAGWTFVYLSADLEAYDDARAMGYAAANVQLWAPSPEGSTAAWSEVVRGRRARRDLLERSAAARLDGAVAEADALEQQAKADFFAGQKEAERQQREHRRRGRGRDGR